MGFSRQEYWSGLPLQVSCIAGKFFTVCEVCNIVQKAVNKTIPKIKKKSEKAKWLSEEALRRAKEWKEAKSKGERERYTQLNSEFQRITRRYKAAFFNEQCLIISWWTYLDKNLSPNFHQGFKDQDLSVLQAFLVNTLRGSPWVCNMRGQHEDNLVECLLWVSFRNRIGFPIHSDVRGWPLALVW